MLSLSAYIIMLYRTVAYQFYFYNRVLLNYLISPFPPTTAMIFDNLVYINNSKLLSLTVICFYISFHCFSLVLAAEWSSWLPLYGNLCCKLVAQPACMTQNVMTGYLSQKVQ